MGIHVDSISHYVILITGCRADSGIDICSGARNVASRMPLLYCKLRFIAFWSESCEQIAELSELAKVPVIIFDVQQQRVQAICP